jgi:hypothetical protein
MPATDLTTRHTMALCSVFCLVPSRGRADLLLTELKTADVSRAEISLLFLERQAGAMPGATDLSAAAAESAGAIRGVFRWIDGIGTLAVPDAGPLIVGGPIAEAMRGANVVSVAAGLMAFGVPSPEASRYEARIKQGHILVAVHIANSDRSDRAREMLAAAEAEDIFTLTEVTTTRTLRGISTASAA